MKIKFFEPFQPGAIAKVKHGNTTDVEENAGYEKVMVGQEDLCRVH